MGELDKINVQLSRVSVREKKGYLYVRGRFPVSGSMVRKEFALKCRNTPQGRRSALIKAKEIDLKLLSNTWEEEEKRTLTFGKAVEQFEKYYWSTREKTKNREYNWNCNERSYFGYIPPDEIFDEKLIKEVLVSLEGGSYKQKTMASHLGALAKYYHIEFDFSPYKNYKPKKNRLSGLPDDQIIIEAIESKRSQHIRVAVILLAYFGLRPHELFRSVGNLLVEPPKIMVGDQTKTQSRIAYPLRIDGDYRYLDEVKALSVDNLSLYDYYSQFIKCDRTNKQMGGRISQWFHQYPFAPNQLRHYYAVRGAMEGKSPAVMAKSMGHSLKIHYKHYASLIDEKAMDQVFR